MRTLLLRSRADRPQTLARRMARRTRFGGPRLLQPLALGLWLLAGFAAAWAQPTPTVTTDKSDYPPGSTVQITGANFAPGEVVQCQVLRIDIDENSGPEHVPWLVTNDASGSFQTSWLVTPDEAGATLTLTAVGLSSGRSAQVVFTDTSNVKSLTVGAPSATPTYGTSQAVSYTVTIVPNGSGGGVVNPTVSGLATDVSYRFTPAALDLGAANKNPTNITLTLTTSASSPAGSRSFTVIVDNGSTNGTLVINAASLAVTANNDTKTYGEVKTYGAGFTTFTSSGLKNGETIGSVTLTASGGTSQTAPVGNYNLVPSAATGGTFNPANYSITYNNGTLSVTALPVVLGGTRAYDGTTAAAAAILVVNNKVSGDTVTISGSGTLASRNVGTQALSSLGNLALGNNNYTLVGASGSVTLTQAPLTITAAPCSKTYDGTTTASTLPSLSAGTVFGSDAANFTESYDNPNAGVNKTLTPAGTVADGNNGNNYHYNFVPQNNGTITAAATTVSLLSSLNPALPGSNVTFTATVRAAGGALLPTGTVQFMSNGTNNGAAVALAGGGTAMLTVPAGSLGHGRSAIAAVFGNTDGNFVSGSAGSLSPAQLVNRPPGTAVNYVTTPLNTKLSFSASALAGVGYDPDGDSMSVTALGGTAKTGSSVALDGSGLITYNPPANFSGQDSFTYTQTDQYGGSTTCTLNVFVNLGNYSSVINNVQALKDGNLQVIAYAVPGQSYQVQATSNTADPNSWVVLGTAAAGTNGVVVYNDLTATNYTARYYRLAVP